MRSRSLVQLVSLALVLSVLACGRCPQGQAPAAAGPHTIRVAQSGQADVVGADNAAIQKAMDMLRPGDTLMIEAGTYRMDNAAMIPVDGVTILGVPGQTILLKAAAVTSRVHDGGDWGEKLFCVEEPQLFKPGMGVAIKDHDDNGGYNVMTATIERIDGDTLKLSNWSICDLDYVGGTARVESTFPVLAAYGRRDLTIRGITADGNKDENPYVLDGCRGGAIYLFNCRACLVDSCVGRNYNGDGISWQITDSISVTGCEATGNTGFGAHPGTGSARSVIRGCHLHHNGAIGFFLCYRVRLGTFSDNLIEYNGAHGISVGHKDSDNLFTGNIIRNNGTSGVFFRPDEPLVGGHRNVFRDNQIYDNGNAEEGYGVLVRPCNQDEVFENNRIAETRAGEERTQRYGVYVYKGDSSVKLAGNTFEGNIKGETFDENGGAALR